MFHIKNIQESLDHLDCNKEGLTTEEANLRTAHYGKNSLPQAKNKTLLHIFLDQFKSPIIYVLLIAAVVSISIKDFEDGGFILAVLFINALIGTYQEYTAGEQADALKKVIITYVQVLRDKKRIELSSEEITLGDIVFFESGVKVPADVRLIESYDLSVNESQLTGESIDVSKNASYISTDKDEPVADRKNMLFAGSLVTTGRATGVVTAVASETEVGKIASLLFAEKVSKPPLVLRMEEFSLNIAKITLFLMLLIVLIGIYQEIPLREIFFLAVALAVSSIPEGLPVAITVALSMASASMSKRNVIVRKLAAIEGLGSCTMIASDKTGTMTQNRLSVEHVVTPSQTFSSHEYINEEILLCSILCNESSSHIENSELKFIGDQVDVALAKYALGIDKTLYEKYNKPQPIDRVPYEPINKYSGMSYKLQGKKIHFIKGSPEVILQKSNFAEHEADTIHKQVDAWADKGFRNIALAYKLSDEAELAEDGYTYLGFSCITDPLREGVADAVKSAEEAGIEVVMITGDHPNTAYYIAKELGIAISKDEVIDGLEMSRWKEQGANKEEIANKRVFARVSPEQKQLIVKTFQELGHFVAVTGDGANDAPALKHANIGISMGKSGTDVARESSDLVLTDDSFSSIVNGIEEGRIAYDNIRKVIHLLIPAGFAEIILVLLSMLFFIPIPLLPVQLLWLNLVTDSIQVMALGLERGEPGILKRKPRAPREPIFNKVMISRVIVGGLYMGLSAFLVFYTLLSYGYDEDMARNITLLLMVLFENIQVFNSRTETLSIFSINHAKNIFLWLSVILAQGLHIVSMHIPFMQSILSIEPVSLKMWGVLLLIAVILVAVLEIEKVIRAKLR
jgi:Ca2+-transporting ATPase